MKLYQDFKITDMWAIHLAKNRYNKLSFELQLSEYYHIIEKISVLFG